MPSVVQTQTVNSVGFMLKERPGDPIVSAFTAVNGRTSPQSPRRSNGMNGMTADTLHVRPFSHPNGESPQDQKGPLPGREQWGSGPRPSENGHYSSSASPEQRDISPQSPPKRKRSTSEEDNRSFHSPPGAPDHGGRRLDSYASAGSSPDRADPVTMEHQHQRTLPPMNSTEHDRNWAPRENHDGVPSNAHYRDHPGSMNPNSMPTANGSVDSEHSHHHHERSSTTELTRAGVQVDPKKRKRQFANRTKTGCGTCRRRKKKCDEAKPECNNCTRGGFICEGYAIKVPWPKNGMSKTHPPLQAKDRYTLEPAQLFHNHGTNREGYQEPGASDGARTRPIVVEEPERQQPPPPRNSWGNWNEHPRPSHPPEQSQPPDYSHAPPASAHGRPPPNPPSEHYPQHAPAQGPPPQRHHRIYHHTPQTMSQVVNNAPAVTSDAPVHHQPQPPVHPPPHHPHQSPSTGAPGPPPPHYAAPPPHRREKSEKDKMLSGEPFIPYHLTLLGEREHCANVLFRFNMTSSDRLQITREERQRHFQAIVAAKWIPRPDIDPHYRGPAPYMSGHVGQEVFVDTPFYCDYGYNLVIGDMATIGPGCKFMDSGRIIIGRNARIGANVTIDTQKVPTDSKSVKGSRGSVIAAEVSIGENVYIGANATILAGVKIGTGAIIHPGSVVMKDVPRDCVARGNPANVQSVNWDD